MDLKDIQIVVSEIDGIITDGTCPIDYMNHTIFKSYYDRDFEAINELKTFFTFVFLADDASVSYNVMRNKNIPSYFVSSKENKLSILSKKIMPKYNMAPNNLLYIGNKLSDIPCMNYAEVRLATNNASNKVKSVANKLLSTESGKGIICEVYEILFSEIEKRIRMS